MFPQECGLRVDAFPCDFRLNFPDVSERIAQKSSSLAPNVFQAALKMVRNALASQRRGQDHAPVETSAMRPHKAKRPPLTYQTVILDYKVGQRDIMLGWFRMVEQHLRSHDDFHDTIVRSVPTILESGNSVIKAAVAYWVVRCIKMQKVRTILSLVSCFRSIIFLTP